ncbi:MAG: HK97 family phage prohead protease [Gammaproteobacteria bacterium]|nr:HK97 family phage prohead protease [Gammaproteobacteria bacterium]
MEAERRYADFRVSGRTLSGRAIPYGEVSPDFAERFLPGAFGPELPTVPLNLQHDTTIELIPAGGLALTDGPRALEVRAELPEGSAALALVRRGALTGFSVEFHAESERREAGIRVIERARLVGVALVDKPGYPGATAEVRASAAHGAPTVFGRFWL